MTALALLFSLMAPGAGQIFIGKFFQGIALGLLFALGKSALLPLSLRIGKVTQLKRTLQFFYVCNWAYIVLILGAAFSAVVQAQTADKTYFFATAFFIICVRVVYKKTLNPFIFTALCGRSGVWAILKKMSKSLSGKE